MPGENLRGWRGRARSLSVIDAMRARSRRGAAALAAGLMALAAPGARAAQAAPPVCNDVAVATSHATPKLINPNCTAHANPAVVATPSPWAVRLSAGAFEYTPVVAFAGTDTFSYRTSNADGVSNTA